MPPQSATRTAPSGDRPRGPLATWSGTPCAGRATGRTDASLFKNFALSDARRIEVRFEAVNIFNHVNLGNPDSEVGVPGTPNTNAGRINSTAFGKGIRSATSSSD